MTKLLEQVFAEVAKLPESEQDRVAQWTLAELDDQHKWDTTFAQSPDLLAEVADQDLEEHRPIRTQELDPDGL